MDYCDACNECWEKKNIKRCENCSDQVCGFCIGGIIKDFQWEDYLVKYDVENMKEIFKQRGWEWTENIIRQDDPRDRFSNKHCPFCTGKINDDTRFIDFLVEKYDINLNEEIECYLSEKRRG